MKLNVDFSSLNESVEKMGAELIEFKIEKTKFTDLDIDKILATTGIEINPIDLEVIDGLLSYEGRQVLLFIPDHSQIDKVIVDSSVGNKYHVSDCGAIERMKHENKFDRYFVTNSVSGKFDIKGFSTKEKKDIETNTELNICKKCLSKLNYKNYRKNKDNVFNAFNLNEFFETYSTHFTNIPKKNKLINENKRIDKDTKELELHHIQELIEYCKNKNKMIHMQSNNYNDEQIIIQRNLYKDYLYCIKYFNILINENIKITKKQLCINLKKKVKLDDICLMITEKI